MAHLTASDGASASRGRLGWRSCLRKGCSRSFQAQRYNQRYCQDPECMREARRWHGAKRQRKCRSQAEGRQRHAEAERQRRKQRGVGGVNTTAKRIRCRGRRLRRTARGHAADGIQRFFATVLAVMSRREIRLALRRLIVETIAVRTCVNPYVIDIDIGANTYDRRCQCCRLP